MNGGNYLLTFDQLFSTRQINMAGLFTFITPLRKKCEQISNSSILTSFIIANIVFTFLEIFIYKRILLLKREFTFYWFLKYNDFFILLFRERLLVWFEDCVESLAETGLLQTESIITKMASLQPKNSGGPITKFWEAPETVSALEHVKGWLCKHAKKVK